MLNFHDPFDRVIMNIEKLQGIVSKAQQSEFEHLQNDSKDKSSIIVREGNKMPNNNGYPTEEELCGGQIISQGGCEICHDCGNSRCGG